ncbi:SPOR domain-containing protein [Alteromonas gracilis]|uniref:SPOR domain-containing protein n=1 Tax=Alteromonas gracilis TaxID=1479524 RepID=UPI0030CF3733
MQSELHERLEYLVNYSSQLIFVSGDSIAQQQKTLEAFVFQQHDETEIAYLTAQDNMDASDYRRQLCRQLLGQVVGSFVRPLNELLVDLNTHEGPILIAITQAHHLPDKLLQELWDLVLQSRFAGNKQHLNVLLFAENQWAESAKQWLPAKNTETPLIISSQSVISEQPQFESDLDKMIASRREAFQAHLENRQRESALTFHNPLKSKWFFVAIATVFLTTFSGLVYWQYGAAISGLFTPIDAKDTTQNLSQATPGSAYDSLLEDVSSASLSDTNDTSVSESTTGSIDETQTSLNTQIQGSKRTETADNVGSDAGLVTDWNTALSSIPVPSSASSNSSIANGETSESASASTSTSTSTSVIDSSIISQPPATPSLLEETGKAIEQEATQQTDVSSQSSNSEPKWITSTEYVIQLLAMKDESVLQDFLRENGLNESTRIYKTQRYGGDWYVVIASTIYPTFDDAQRARASLPDFPGKQNTFVKSGDQVLNELALDGSSEQ